MHLQVYHGQTGCSKTHFQHPATTNANSDELCCAFIELCIHESSPAKFIEIGFVLTSQNQNKTNCFWWKTPCLTINRSVTKKGCDKTRWCGVQSKFSKINTNKQLYVGSCAYGHSFLLGNCFAQNRWSRFSVDDDEPPTPKNQTGQTYRLDVQGGWLGQIDGFNRGSWLFVRYGLVTIARR